MSTFPKSFRFGVADADLQVIGEEQTIKNEHSQPTMWDTFARHSDKVYKHQPPGRGIDRYNRWPEDITHLEKLGIKHYRTSISMARLFHPNGTLNEAAVNWYKTYFAALKKSNISLYLTLYHWELPESLKKKGGLTNREVVKFFTKHALAVYDNFNEYIDEYFLLNEPWASSFLSYFYGLHAPGETNLTHALLAAHHLLLAQGKMYEALISRNRSLKIGTVLNVHPTYPHTPEENDKKAAKFAQGVNLTWFMDPMYKGVYPEFMSRLFDIHLPTFPKEDMKAIAIGENLYSLGINYYNGRLISHDKKSTLPFATIIKEEALTNDLGWPIFLPPHYPEGLFDTVSDVYSQYKALGLHRLYITENGIALKTPWDGKSNSIDDEKRIFYYKEHLQQIKKALNQDIPIEAFFAWTFMDNYEWGYGYAPESAFGLIHVDRKSLQRVWKKSAFWYKTLNETKKLQ